MHEDGIGVVDRCHAADIVGRYGGRDDSPDLGIDLRGGRFRGWREAGAGEEKK